MGDLKFDPRLDHPLRKVSRVQQFFQPLLDRIATVTEEVTIFVDVRVLGFFVLVKAFTKSRVLEAKLTRMLDEMALKLVSKVLVNVRYKPYTLPDCEASCEDMNILEFKLAKDSFSRVLKLRLISLLLILVA